MVQVHTILADDKHYCKPTFKRFFNCKWLVHLRIFILPTKHFCTLFIYFPHKTLLWFMWDEIFSTSIHMIFRLMKTWKQLTIKMQSSMTNSTSGKKSSQVCTYNMAEIYTCSTDCVFVLYGWGRLIAGYSLSTDCTPEEFTKCMPECCSESKCQTKTEDQCQLMSINEIINGSVCRTIWFRYKVFKRMSQSMISKHMWDWPWVSDNG